MARHWFGFPFLQIDFLVVSQEESKIKNHTFRIENGLERRKGLNCLEKGSSGGSQLMPDFKKERKKEIFIHADLMGNRPSCQNPKAKLSGGFGIRGFSWWKLLPVCAHQQCHVNVRGSGGGEIDPEKSWGRVVSETHTAAPVSLNQPERAAEIIRKSGQRKAGFSVCGHFRDL